MPKLNLTDLKVNSFITKMKKETAQTAKGGWHHTCPINDPEFYTTPCNCNTSVGQICYDLR